MILVSVKSVLMIGVFYITPHWFYNQYNDTTSPLNADRKIFGRMSNYGYAFDSNTRKDLPILDSLIQAQPDSFSIKTLTESDFPDSQVTK